MTRGPHLRVGSFPFVRGERLFSGFGDARGGEAWLFDPSPEPRSPQGREVSSVPDQFDVSLEDSDLLGEVELTTNLIIAASETDEHLTRRGDRRDPRGRAAGAAPDARRTPVSRSRTAPARC